MVENSKNLLPTDGWCTKIFYNCCSMRFFLYLNEEQFYYVVTLFAFVTRFMANYVNTLYRATFI